ncbi:MAG: periplasmic heavy metal sensor [Rhodobacteraceae bacterium]|nr:periplasmic heavy metal sensor [Paracoccaceae bacterium]MCP5342745.1 periplasmic heavy metal sensor [Paracoccaceae bacterium]
MARMGTNDSSGGKGGSGKWTRLVLVVSLALNLLVAGIVVGGAMRHHWYGPQGPARDIGFGPFTQALSKEDRKALRGAFMAANPGFLDMRQDMRRDMNALIAALRAEPWDKDAAGAILAGQSHRMTEWMDIGREVLLERIAAMTPDERAAFADRLAAMGKGSWRARGSWR